MMRRMLAGAVALSLVPGGGATAGKAAGEWHLLAGLPSLGTVTWRCATPHGRHALAFAVPFRQGATTGVRLYAGGRLRERATVDPGERARFSGYGLEQRLEATQFTGAGTIRASVAARFERRPVVSHCTRYSPPALVIRVTPRR